jgi:putative nucleotidyltransferase with HDIG domain
MLTDTVTKTLAVDAACVLLLNPISNLLEYASRRGFHTGALRHTRLQLGEGYAGRAALERRMVSVPNLADASEFGPAPFLRGEAVVAYFAVPLIARGKVKGVLEVLHRRPMAPDPDWMVMLGVLGAQAAIAIDNAEMFKDLEDQNTELALAYESTLAGWARALELRDKETLGHSQHVADMTVRLAREWKMGESELVHVRRGALLHDIGKMGVPDHILRKPGALTPEEWAVMRMHPQYAYDMLSPIPYLRPALDIPYFHHEKWDGTGYPQGLKGDQIPLAARLFAVVDVWDALRSDRPYRPAWAEERAWAHILEQAGKHFDPKVVEAFRGVRLSEISVSRKL